MVRTLDEVARKTKRENDNLKTRGELDGKVNRNVKHNDNLGGSGALQALLVGKETQQRLQQFSCTLGLHISGNNKGAALSYTNAYI
ncbi:hypothetical protein SUGI_0228610 [Cryptomeria japonica]|nr:hypothetical protein SUGI_0228610 [Cryptomeria japonica]